MSIDTYTNILCLLTHYKQHSNLSDAQWKKICNLAQSLDALLLQRDRESAKHRVIN